MSWLSSLAQVSFFYAYAYACVASEDRALAAVLSTEADNDCVINIKRFRLVPFNFNLTSV